MASAGGRMTLRMKRDGRVDLLIQRYEARRAVLSLVTSQRSGRSWRERIRCRETGAEMDVVEMYINNGAQAMREEAISVGERGRVMAHSGAASDLQGRGDATDGGADTSVHTRYSSW